MEPRILKSSELYKAQLDHIWEDGKESLVDSHSEPISDQKVLSANKW